MQVKHLLLIAILGLTAACSSNKEVIDENLSEAELYQQAQADLDNSSYTSAVNKLKALESRYPFGRYAEQAQLNLICAYYKNMEPEAAKSAAERFIRLHRSALVAKDAIAGFEKGAPEDGEQQWQALLRGIPEKLPVSRRQWPLVKTYAKQLSS